MTSPSFPGKTIGEQLHNADRKCRHRQGAVPRKRELFHVPRMTTEA
jgi:hypothetical protein